MNGHGKHNGVMENGTDGEMDCGGGRRVVERAEMTSQTILSPTTPALTMCRHLVETIRDRLHSKWNIILILLIVFK